MPHNKILPPSTTTTAPTNDLDRAIKVLKAKVDPYTKLINYYDGEQDLKYVSHRMTKIFKDLDADFSENWCSVVIDSTYDRVTLTGFLIPDDEDAQKILNEIMKSSELILDSFDIHKIAGAVGESFVIADKDEDEVQAFYNDPRLVHIFYEGGNPKAKRYAAKWWVDNANRIRVTLYYHDHFEYYRSFKEDHELQFDQTAKEFGSVDVDGEPVEDADNWADNDLGIIPVFHYRPDRRKIKSDLKNAIPIQDAVNKLVSDMMISSEFAAMRQRYIISNSDIEGLLKNAPNEVWDIPAGDGEGQDTEVGELDQYDPRVYLNPVDREVAAMGAITSTPQHFFFKSGGSNVSGEALIALESPLNAKAKRRIDLFAPVWAETASFLLLLRGIDIPREKIVPVFNRPETVQPKTEAEIREINTKAGIPIETSLAWEGKTESEIENLKKARADARAAEAAGLGAALARMERERDQEGSAE